MFPIFLAYVNMYEKLTYFNICADITKKKSVDLIPMRNIFEESESSTTSESTSSDGEKVIFNYCSILYRICICLHNYNILMYFFPCY